MAHTAESPAAVARGRAQNYRQLSKLTAKQIAAPHQACNSLPATTCQDASPYSIRVLTARFGLSPRRARLVAELAGLAVQQ